MGPDGGINGGQIIAEGSPEKITEIKTREDDYVVQIFTANSHTPIYFFPHKDSFIN